MSLLLSALDVTVSVEAPEALLRRLRQLLPAAAAGRAPDLALRWDGQTVTSPAQSTTAGTEPEALEVLLAAINRAAIDQCRSWAAHCGVVTRRGSAVAFPATSGGGKSTLVAACLASGWEYVSDEALVVDWTTGVLRAYAKPLSLSRWALRRLDLPDPPAGRVERPVEPRELGAQAASGPLRLAHIVTLHRRPGEAALSSSDRAVAAMALLRHSFNHYQRPAAAVELVAVLARAAQAWTLDYDDPVDAALLLGGRLG